MSSWNTDIPAQDTTLLTDLEWLQHLCNAVNQRLTAWEQVPLVGPAGTPPEFGVAAGDDVQDSAFWRPLQGYVSLTLLVPVWARQDGPVDGPTGFVLWSETSLRSSLGLTNGEFRATPPPHPTYWRRKTPREVADPSQDNDTQGNALADGMIARLLNDERIYTRVAGEWVSTPAAVPDVLDSDNPASGNAHVDPGVMEPGDYLGPWVLSELRSVLNALVWVIDPYPVIAEDGATTQLGQGATAAAADADYPSGVGGFNFTTSDSAPVVLGSAATQIDLAGGGVDAYAAQTISNTASSELIAGLAATVDFYVRAEITHVYPFASLTFSPQGASWLVNGQWVKWVTVGPGEGPAVTPPWSSSVPLDWPPAIAGSKTACGYTILRDNAAYTDVIAVLKYDGPGGFDEQAGT
jgi:hypothetical protein